MDSQLQNNGIACFERLFFGLDASIPSDTSRKETKIAFGDDKAAKLLDQYSSRP